MIDEAGFDFVALDANAIIADSALQNVGFEYLKSYAVSANATILLPEVAFREIREHLQVEVDRLSAAADELRMRGPQLGISALRTIPTSNGEWADTAFEQLRSRLEWLGVEIKAVPEVPHREILDRMAAAIRPFHGGKQKDAGYKDYLIWRSLLGLAGPAQHEAITRVAFVTGNVRDFARSDDSAALHSDSYREARAAGLAITLYRSVRELGSQLRVLLPASEQLQLQLARDAERAALEDWVFEAIEYYQLEEAIDDDVLEPYLRDAVLSNERPDLDEWELILEQPEVLNINGVRLEGPSEVRSLGGGRVAAEFWSEWSARVEVRWTAGARSGRTEADIPLFIPLAFALTDGEPLRPTGGVTLWPGPNNTSWPDESDDD